MISLLVILLIILNLSIFLTFDKFAKIINVYDTPDKKLKLHKKKTPILGGLILVINYFIIFLFQIFYSNFFLSFEKRLLEVQDFFSIILLVISFFLIGFYDDKKNLSPNKKIIISIFLIFLSLFISQNLQIDKISLSFYDHKIFFNKFSFIFTVFSILLFVNSLNFYDGINGQSCFFFLIIFIFLFLKDMNIFYLLTIILIFFILTLNLRNKLFLGDSGIFLLSIIASISLIFEHNINKNIVYADEIFFLLLFPGLDLVRLTVIRITKNKNPFYGDRNHIHHLLTKKFSISISNLILLIYAITPIILFNVLNLNFYSSFLIFLFMYFVLVLIMSSHDKKYN